MYPEQYGVLKYLPFEGFEYSTSPVDIEAWAKDNRINDKNQLKDDRPHPISSGDILYIANTKMLVK